MGEQFNLLFPDGMWLTQIPQRGQKRAFVLLLFFLP